MARLINLDEKEAEWGAEIERLKKKAYEIDKIIFEQQEKKAVLANEISRYVRFIETAKEMGMSNSNCKPSMREQRSSARRSLKGFKLPQAIRSIMMGEPQRKFTGTEIADLLLERGYVSDSPNFRTIIYNTIIRMVNKGEIEIDKTGFKHLYKIKADDSESLST